MPNKTYTHRDLLSINRQFTIGKMSNKKSHKSKKSPHYGFLLSQQENRSKIAYVNRETDFAKFKPTATTKHNKKADSLAQPEAKESMKKDILRSLSIISLILILELMVYLAWNKFIVK